MNEFSETRILLGSLGWSWPGWVDNFYPQDMPPEWRLAYYNTQFDCVFVPSVQWLGVANAELEQWREDTREQFLFLLEDGDGGDIPQPLQGRAVRTAAQNERILWFDAQSEIKQLADDIRTMQEGTCFLLSRDGDLSQLERVRTLLELLGVRA
jgi:hypothetical protein